MAKGLMAKGSKARGLRVEETRARGADTPRTEWGQWALPQGSRDNGQVPREMGKGGQWVEVKRAVRQGVEGPEAKGPEDDGSDS